MLRQLIAATTALLIGTLWITASPSLATHSFKTLDGTEHTFHKTNNTSATLLLIITQKEDLKEAFRLATILPKSSSSSEASDSDNNAQAYKTYLALDLTNLNVFKARSLKSAANKYLKNDASRQTITFLENNSILNILDAHNQAPTKSALINAQGTIIWTSSQYPDDSTLAQITSEPPSK